MATIFGYSPPDEGGTGEGYYFNTPQNPATVLTGGGFVDTGKVLPSGEAIYALRASGNPTQFTLDILRTRIVRVTPGVDKTTGIISQADAVAWNAAHPGDPVYCVFR